ncbi:MAG: diguanylate cyclase [Ghiorsea sp.]
METIVEGESLTRLRDDPSRVVILGGGRGGTAMLETLLEEDLVQVVAMVDLDEKTPGCQMARHHGIQTFSDVETAIIASAPCVVFNLTSNEMVEEVAANILGVGGVIGGLEARLMWRMVTNLKEAKRDLEFQASHDVLTNLVNRRFMIQKMEQELDRCKRYGVVCSLVMIDLDYFKRVNDDYGHAAGDVVLKEVAARISEHLRGADTLARWGGEEFLILLPHTNTKAAKIAVEKCLQVIVSEEIALDVNLGVQMSFSAGIACFNELKDEKSIDGMVDELLMLADRRLYQAKGLGRSCIVSHD